MSALLGPCARQPGSDMIISLEQAPVSTSHYSIEEIANFRPSIIATPDGYF